MSSDDDLDADDAALTAALDAYLEPFKIVTIQDGGVVPVTVDPHADLRDELAARRARRKA